MPTDTKQPAAPTVTTIATIRTKDPELIAALDDAADIQRRSRTAQALHYITQGLIADGYLEDEGRGAK